MERYRSICTSFGVHSVDRNVRVGPLVTASVMGSRIQPLEYDASYGFVAEGVVRDAFVLVVREDIAKGR